LKEEVSSRSHGSQQLCQKLVLAGEGGVAYNKAADMITVLTNIIHPSILHTHCYSIDVA